jgi:hypothetical protein
VAPLALAGVLAIVAGGCGGSASVKQAAAGTPPAASGPPKCPAQWAAGWRKLAKRIDAPVYCPSWMPSPLDAQIGGVWFNGEDVSKDGAYLVSFVYQETTPTGGEEVHVNFRGYPGQTAIPICEDTLVTNGKVTRPKIPCFSDARGERRIGTSKVTIYTANQGVDAWHVLYAWRRSGTLYTISEHVVPPYTYKQVIGNLDRMLRGLVLLHP